MQCNPARATTRSQTLLFSQANRQTRFRFDSWNSDLGKLRYLPPSLRWPAWPNNKLYSIYVLYSTIVCITVHCFGVQYLSSTTRAIVWNDIQQKIISCLVGTILEILVKAQSFHCSGAVVPGTGLCQDHRRRLLWWCLRHTPKIDAGCAPEINSDRAKQWRNRKRQNTIDLWRTVKDYTVVVISYTNGNPRKLFSFYFIQFSQSKRNIERIDVGDNLRIESA